jgi:hypothetical protein
MKYFKMSQSGFLDFSGRNPVHETTRERERELAIILVIYHRAWRAAVAFDEKRILLTVFLPSFLSPRTQGPNRPPPPTCSILGFLEYRS